MPTKVGLLLVHGEQFCPSCCHQWLTWVLPGAESRFTGCNPSP